MLEYTVFGVGLRNFFSLAVVTQLIMQTCYHVDPVLPARVMYPHFFQPVCLWCPQLADGRCCVSLPKMGYMLV